MMRVILIKALFLAFGLSTVSAQDAPKSKKHFSWTKPYMDEVGISDEVQAKILVVKKENDAELKKINQNTALSEEEKKIQVAEILKKRSINIHALITPEQKKKAFEIMARIKKENEDSGH